MRQKREKSRKQQVRRDGANTEKLRRQRQKVRVERVHSYLFSVSEVRLLIGSGTDRRIRS